jgi:hypothetical protein
MLQDNAWKHADKSLVVEVITCGPRGEILTDLTAPDAGYRIHAFLGMGGFGEVWEAEPVSNPEKKVAIKLFFPPDRVSSPAMEESLRLEALRNRSELRGLTNVVIKWHRQLTVDSVRSPGWPQHGFVMDRAYCSLADRLAEERTISEQEAVRICRRLITIVSQLHRLGVVHCDLKPQNLLYQTENDSESLVLGDLGTVTNEGQPHSIRLGQDAAGHRAPELLVSPDRSGGKIVALRSEDVYALGVIFGKLAEKIEGDKQWLQSVVSRMTADHPADRPPLDRSLLMMVSPHLQQSYDVLRHKAGWKIGDPRYQRLYGREWLRDEFEKFCEQQRSKQCGGLFLLSAQSGMGKTAALTEWNTYSDLGWRNQALKSGDIEVPEQLPIGYYFQHGHDTFSRGNFLPVILQQLQQEPYKLTVPEELKANPKLDSQTLLTLLMEAARKPRQKGRALVLLIDAIDEADEPQELRQFLINLCKPSDGRGLPDGLFLVVGTRPLDSLGESLTEPLTSLGDFVKHIDLDSQSVRDGIENKNELEEFWKRECRLLLREELVEDHCRNASLAVRAASGIPMILRLVIDEIASDRLTLNEFLKRPVTNSLMQWLETEWDRLLQKTSTAERINLIRLAAFLAAVREPVTPELLALWLNTGIWNVDRDLQAMSWLLSMQEDRWSLRHASMRELLLLEKAVAKTIGPAHHTIADLALRSIRGELNENELQLLTDQDRTLLHSYAVRHVISHLLSAAEAGHNRGKRITDALLLLTDPAWLHQRLNLCSTP